MPVEVLHHDEPVMGTVVSFDCYLTGVERRDVILGLVRARRTLHRVDALFSTYRDHSPISRLRRGELASEDVPREIGEVLALCERVRLLSDGWFDPWALPGGVDPTGLVKGWSAERALEDLVGAGLEVGVVNAGGDIVTVGSPEPGVLWRFGIRSPDGPDRLAAVAEVRHAIATSGTYERGLHLYDPKGSRIASGAALSATVIGADLAVADGLATALAVAGPPLLARLEELGYDGLVILAGGARYATRDFPFAAPGPGEG